MAGITLHSENNETVTCVPNVFIDELMAERGRRICENLLISFTLHERPGGILFHLRHGGQVRAYGKKISGARLPTGKRQRYSISNMTMTAD